MEPIFKVGDEVKIKRRVGNRSNYKYSFEDNMAKLVGNVFTISSILPDHCQTKCIVPDDDALYHLKNVPYAWSSGMLEKVSENSSDFLANPPKSLVKSRKKLVLNFKV
jgi:hypothetical protein